MCVAKGDNCSFFFKKTQRLGYYQQTDDWWSEREADRGNHACIAPEPEDERTWASTAISYYEPEKLARADTGCALAAFRVARSRSETDRPGARPRTLDKTQVKWHRSRARAHSARRTWEVRRREASSFSRPGRRRAPGAARVRQGPGGKMRGTEGEREWGKAHHPLAICPQPEERRRIGPQPPRNHGLHKGFKPRSGEPKQWNGPFWSGWMSSLPSFDSI